jgi:hypothetical protein
MPSKSPLQVVDLITGARGYLGSLSDEIINRPASDAFGRGDRSN